MSPLPLNPNRSLDLLGVPMDLGGARRGCDMGPSAFRVAGLDQRLTKLGYDVRDCGDIVLEARQVSASGDERARFLGAIAQGCDDLRGRVRQSMEAGRFPLVLGGDHSIAIGTISGVAEHLRSQDQRLGVLWVDAHADMNTPGSSPSGNIHGMPLQVLLGGGPDELVQLGGFAPKIDPSQVALIGIRDLDKRERTLVEESGVTAFTMKEVDRLGMNRVVEASLERVCSGTAGIHVSFDLDSLDPAIAPGVGTPVAGGLTYREAHLLMELVADTGALRSLEVVEQNPILDERNRTAEIGTGLILSALGRQIL